MTEQRIAVLGAGPAGATSALGLKRLGYSVVVISDWRRFAAIEGISQRVFQAIRHAGLQHAAGCVNTPSVRHVSWNGTLQMPNHEHLIDRVVFDSALRQDVRAAGIELVEARILGIETHETGHRIHLNNDRTLEADFLVEARGRQAPVAEGRWRGPETISLLSHWVDVPGRQESAVESVQDGWSWMARLADGRCYWQLTLDATACALPEKAHLPQYCAERRSQSSLVTDLFGGAALAPAELHARSSTAILTRDLCGANWIRVGDAAMAVDPLSGNGIFQSLSSALQAPAVIHTMLSQPGRAELARRFHQQRVEQLFLRFARTGRDFYAMEARWPENNFWKARRTWPDTAPMHASVTADQIRIAKAPVIRGSTIEEAEVVITPDQPLGVWHFQGIELAPLVRRLQAAEVGSADVLGEVAEPQRSALRAWLLEQGWMPRHSVG